MKITFKSWSFYILKIKWFCHFDSDFFWSYRNSYSHTMSQVVPKNVLCFIYKLQKNFVFLLLSPVYYIAYYNGAHLYSVKYFSWILTIYKVWYSAIHILCHGFMCFYIFIWISLPFHIFFGVGHRWNLRFFMFSAFFFQALPMCFLFTFLLKMHIYRNELYFEMYLYDYLDNNNHVFFI